jgi:hypothetical protein
MSYREVGKATLQRFTTLKVIPVVRLRERERDAAWARALIRRLLARRSAAESFVLIGFPPNV